MNIKPLVMILSLVGVLASCTDYTVSVPSSSSNPSSNTTATKRIDLNFSHTTSYENEEVTLPSDEEDEIRINVFYKLRIQWTISAATFSNLPESGLPSRLEVCFGNNANLTSLQENILVGQVKGGSSFLFVKVSGTSNCYQSFFTLTEDAGTSGTTKLWFRLYMNSLVSAFDEQQVTFRVTSRLNTYNIRVNVDDEGYYRQIFSLVRGVYSDFGIDNLYSGVYKTIRIYIPAANQKIGLRAYKHNDPQTLYLPEIIYDVNSPDPIGTAFTSTNNRYFDVNLLDLMALQVGGAQFALNIHAIFEVKAYESDNYEAQIRTIEFNPQEELADW